MTHNYKSLSETLVSEFKNKIFTKYKNYLSGDDLTVTLFKIDRKNTVFNEHSETVYEKIGTESGVRFVMIENYKLYNSTEIIADVNWSVETGYKPEEVAFEAVSAPLAIQPNVGDYISFKYSDSVLLFEVAPEVQEFSLEAKYYKKLKLKLTRYKQEDILPQITDRLTYIPSKDIMIPNHIYELVDVLREKEEGLFNKLMTNFYDYDKRKFNNDIISVDMSCFLKDSLSKLLYPINTNISYDSEESLFSLIFNKKVESILSINIDYMMAYYENYTVDANVEEFRVKLFRMLKLMKLNTILVNKEVIGEYITEIDSSIYFTSTTNDNTIISNTLISHDRDDLVDSVIENLDLGREDYDNNYIVNLILENDLYNNSYNLPLILSLILTDRFTDNIDNIYPLMIMTMNEDIDYESNFNVCDFILKLVLTMVILNQTNLTEVQYSCDKFKLQTLFDEF